MPPITDEIPDPERGGGTRLDPERAGGSRPVDLACTGVVSERQGDKPVDRAPTGGKDVDSHRTGLKGDEIDRESVGLGREGVEDALPEHATVKAVDPQRQGLKGVEIERCSIGLGREGVKDIHPELDSVNGVESPRGAMISVLPSDADLALGDADPIPDGGSLSIPRYAAESQRFPFPRTGDPRSLAKAFIKEIVDELQSTDLQQFSKSNLSRRVRMPGRISHPRIGYRQIGWTSTGRESNSYRMLNRLQSRLQSVAS